MNKLDNIRSFVKDVNNLIKKYDRFNRPNPTDPLLTKIKLVIKRRFNIIRLWLSSSYRRFWDHYRVSQLDSRQATTISSQFSLELSVVRDSTISENLSETEQEEDLQQREIRAVDEAHREAEAKEQAIADATTKKEKLQKEIVTLQKEINDIPEIVQDLNAKLMDLLIKEHSLSETPSNNQNEKITEGLDLAKKGIAKVRCLIVDATAIKITNEKKLAEKEKEIATLETFLKEVELEVASSEEELSQPEIFNKDSQVEDESYNTPAVVSEDEPVEQLIPPQKKRLYEILKKLHPDLEESLSKSLSLFSKLAIRSVEETGSGKISLIFEKAVSYLFYLPSDNVKGLIVTIGDKTGKVQLKVNTEEKKLELISGVKLFTYVKLGLLSKEITLNPKLYLSFDDEKINYKITNLGLLWSGAEKVLKLVGVDPQTEGKYYYNWISKDLEIYEKYPQLFEAVEGKPFEILKKLSKAQVTVFQNLDESFQEQLHDRASQDLTNETEAPA